MDETTDWTERQARLAASLGTSEQVARAFATVPRHRFIPSRVWTGLVGPPLDRDADPDAWADLVFADDAVTTQVNDGEDGRANFPTSSSSQPSVMAAMIEAAGVEAGMRVLEIGAGTGYNAAILKELAGVGGRVATVEVDPAVAAGARLSLKNAGYDVAVVDGDGADGHAAAAPFDITLATCAVVRFPASWIAQTRPGGRVVAPWKASAALPGGLLARLVVDDDGSAGGRFAGGASFMMMRSQRWSGPMHGRDDEPEETRTAAGDPSAIVADEASGPVLAMTVPAWRFAPRRWPDGSEGVWVSATDRPAWARLYADGRVEQGGQRRLWDELESAHRAWVGHGRPAFTDYGLTVAPDGTHRVWLHDPAGPTWVQPRGDA
ncbi:methyltransferase domain-containing protein [Nocardiopsis sediminis]|uniref:Protein-L-isoaspartate O-methyltransferase n=1 Tax=Nocardiopsis sediminis TaxID=1778267 RepID=A0ABV8FUC9_9ACTN